MVQKEIVKQQADVDQWEKDESYEEGEVVKLAVGESIEGLLIDKYASVKYNTCIYKIKDKHDDSIKVVLGTTILDKLMEPKQIGDVVKIKRLSDNVSQGGRSYQNWETYHLHRSASMEV